jgi:large subunit ribosomal protein L25
MSEENIINVQLRDRVGKGSARAARREGLVPGVIYGDKQPPQPVSVARRELDRQIASGAFFNTLYDLKTPNGTERVLPRDVQFHVVTDVPLHVDFLRVSKDAEVSIDVPVVFVGEEESPGLRRGGVLNIVRHEIEMHCRADAIPEQIEASLKGLDIGDSLHISAIALPDGVRPTITDRDFTIATIAAPTVTPTEEEEGEEAEGEVEAEAKEGGEE